MVLEGIVFGFYLLLVDYYLLTNKQLTLPTISRIMIALLTTMFWSENSLFRWCNTFE